MHALTSPTRLFVALVVLTLPLAACSSDATVAGEVRLAVESSKLGETVVDGQGMTVYAFVPDDRGEPTCTGECTSTWSPVEGPAEAGEGVEEGLLGTVEHPGGTTQVTYDGWPLYRFAGDQGPGAVSGHGMDGNWYAVGPDGQPLEDADAHAPEDSGY